MTVNPLHPSVAGRDAAAADPRSGHHRRRSAPLLPIDWRAARRADRACCCPARPVVIVILPPASGRPHPVDLLLCGHHYRASRRALAAAGALVVDMQGDDLAEEAWPG